MYNICTFLPFEVFKMYINYGNYQEDIQEGYINKSVPLWINSCGTYKLITKKEMPTFRPKGRLDYQLIYIHSGCGHFIFDESSPIVVPAGNIVIYRPNETQNYIYYGDDEPLIYWIHFSGADLEYLLKKYGLNPDDRTLSVGVSSDYIRLFNKIILELQLKRPHYDTDSALLFMQIIILMGRIHEKRELSIPATVRLEIEHAMDYFHEHYHDQICIEQYLKDNNLSKNSFFRKFKVFTGVTPLQYVLDIRLSTAKRLLVETDYTINDIAMSVGYDNALYFSRLFHKHIGKSPREFRAGR